MSRIIAMGMAARGWLRRRRRFALAMPMLLLSLAAACGGAPSLANAPTTNGKVAPIPPFSPLNFHNPTAITNTWYPLVPGGTGTGVFRGIERDSPYQLEQWVTNDTRVIDGVTARAVQDKDSVSGQVVGGAIDYYAQDDQGNVWYMGEETTHYVNGQLSDHADSWIGGVKGARPGIFMPANPRVGSPPYQQEFAPNLAADVAHVNTSESVCVTLRCFDNVFELHETSVLDPGTVAAKYYAPGMGFIKERILQGDRYDFDLVSTTPITAAP